MGVTDFGQEFGAKVRKLRKARNISLRKFAAMVNMSPTYLSKVERGEFPPPAEEKVVAIADALNQNPDELLALAGRVASDLDGIIQQQPTEMATFLRAATGLSSATLQLFAEEAQKAKREEIQTVIVGATPKAKPKRGKDDK
ncbi:helix-turn-helix domain-containing protein [Acidobacteria bacterium AH-259-D05]|nr:helix-turn-helix domain-containing protein [Acidobacteria bacterium AH-259-D05]